MSDSKIDWSKGTLTQPANPENNNEAIDWNNGTLTHPDEIPVKKNKGIVGHLQDTAASLASGLASVPDMAVGVADMYTEGRAGKAIDDTGVYKMGEASKYWQDKKTDIAKEQDKTRQSTEGIWNKTKYVLENPSQITNAVVESAPSILAGGVAGRISKIANPLVAGAVGEGIVGAGAQAENIRQQTNDGLLDNGQQAAAAGTGALTSLFSMAGGKLAQKMGIGDVDTLLTRGHATPAQVAGEIASMPAKSLPRKVIEGAISEGFLEELPQSVSEQIIQNLALDKPWHEGVEDAAVMGTLAGMAMGGAAAPFHGNPPTSPSGQDNNLPPENPNNPVSPNSPGGTGGNGINRPQQGNNPVAPVGLTGAPLSPVAPVNPVGNTNYDPTQPINTQANADSTTISGLLPAAQPDAAQSNPAMANFDPAPALALLAEVKRRKDAERAAQATQPQAPSEQMGINPNDGALSEAAALAVDTGVSAQIESQATAQAAMQDTGSLESAVSLSETMRTSTAQDIKQAFNNIASSASEGARDQVAEYINTGNTERLTYSKPDAVQAAINNPDYNVQQNEDGSATVIGVRTADDVWHGMAPDTQTPIESSNAVSEPGNQNAQIEQAATPQNDTQAQAQTTASEDGNLVDALPITETKSSQQADQAGSLASTLVNFEDQLDAQANKSAPVFSKSAKASEYLRTNDLTDTHEVAANEDGLYEVRPKATEPTPDWNTDAKSAPAAPAILGADGKNKWFAGLDKANAFIDKKGIADTHEVTQVGNRFEITPKAAQPTANAEAQVQPNTSQIADLEQQLANEKSVPKKAQLRKQITELQNGLADQPQGDVPNPYNENQLRANVRNLSLQASKEAQAQNAEDSNYIADLGSTASALSNEKVKQQFPELYKRAEELAKTAEIRSAGRRGNTNFSSLSFKGDSSFVSGDSWTTRPTKDEILQQAIWHLSQDDKNGTSSANQAAVTQTNSNKEISATEKNIREALNRNDKHNNGAKMQDLATIVANRIKKEGPEYFTLGWNKDSQMTAEAYDFIETMLDEATSNLGIKGFDDAERFGKLTKDVLESVEDVYTPAADSSWDDRPVKNKDGNYEAPKLVKVKDENGRTRYVLENELNDPSIEHLRNFSESGRRSVIKVSRNSISLDTPQNEQNTQEQPAPASTQQSVSRTDDPKPKKGKTLIGKNSEGSNLYEDEVGVRHVSVGGGVTMSEDVAFVPSRNGVTIDTSGRENRFKTESEVAGIVPTPTQDNAAKPKTSTNTIFTEDAAAAARARLKAKLGRLNSGLDPEMMIDGIVLAGYHIEKGARSFAAYAKAMTEDMGDMVKPYLKSWYMGVKYDPRASGFDGMSSAAEVESFDVDSINNGVDTKDEAINVRAADKAFKRIGFKAIADDLWHKTEGGKLAWRIAPTLDAKGLMLQAVEDGQAYDEMRINFDDMPRSDAKTYQKMAAEFDEYIKNEYGQDADERSTQQNNSQSKESSKIDLEFKQDGENEQSTSSTLNPQGTSAVRGGRGRTSQQNDAQGDNPDVEAGVSTGSAAAGAKEPSGRSGIRGAREDVANDAGVSGRGMESSRREDAGADGSLPTGARRGVTSLAATASAATDFHMTDPVAIIGGTQVRRFDKNKAALELLEELTSEGRQATTEEQAVLAGYTGWGSFGQDLFQGTWDKPVFKDESTWKERNQWLREKLGKAAWESAKDSTINAHFTDPYTVGAMWSMAEKMGFTGGRVLEPAIGTGNFISLMPQHLKQRSQVTGIDLDITTAAIAKQLFPQSNVQNMPYQKSKTPDNFYDLIISNVPFADIKIADRRYNQFNPNLHDYYFLKMLDQVRPGGVVMAITSSGTMDKKSEVIRRELAKQAELVTAVRLPTGAFQEYAGTAVVTDIIVLRKRDKPLAMTPDEKWIKPTVVITQSGNPVVVNSFFAGNPQNIIGTIDFGHGTTRFGAGMIVHRPDDMKERLEKIADFVPENVLSPRHDENHLTYYANKAGERTNTLTINNGELMFVHGDQMVKATDLAEYKLKDAKKTAQRQKSIEDLIAIRKAYTDLTDAERTEQDNVEQLRKTLNKLYQAYTKEHGPLADSFGLQYFRKLDDAYYYSLAALEVNGKPAEILKRSVVRGAAALDNPTVSDAFVVERNKSASPSLANIAKMANVSEDQARAELIENGAVYVLPNGDIMPSDMYLSGNVRLKLEEAQNAVAEGNSDLQRNVDALKEIIPEDIPYFNIEAKMGATWVPLAEYENYIAHMLGMTDSDGITVTFPSGKWKVKLESVASRRTEASTNYGSKYKSFQTVVSAALSNQTITVKYKNADGSESVDIEATEEVNGKISKIKEDFAQWLWSDPERRVQLEREYNRTFNAWATPKYDGSFMSMQGMALNLGNGPFNLRQHQQNAIWRAIVNRRSINAHEVGTGKTFTMGGIALESRRYGIAKKPLILAHNANSAAVAKEIQMMYPSARILFISELGKAVRQIRMRQIANDDWDVVVMPHSMIDKLTLSEETLMAMAADDIAALETELEEALAEEGGATLDEVLAMTSEDVNKKMGFKNPTAKQLAKQRLKLIEDIQKQAMGASKADAVNFEELGIDMIMVDEVHEFKKPSIATRMNMKGLNTSSNKRSVNLQLLTRYVRRMNNGGNVHTFTGTPITNTLTEIYHQMRYVMEEEMQKLNVAAWDGWFGSFATDITDIELSATGEYQLVTRLAGFVNVPELRKMIGQFMDIVFANDMPEMQPRKTKSGKVLSDDGLTEAEKAELLNGRTEGAKDRPYKKVVNITTEMSPKQDEALIAIQSLAKEWESASGKQKREWMRNGDPRSPLSISTAAKKASYDARIGDPDFIGQEGLTQDHEMSKASQVVKNVMEVYHSHPLASQVIFADTGYNTTTERSTGAKDDNGKAIRERIKTFSPIKDIVERLVQAGIPRDQIAIVNGEVKAEARKAIADKVNTGEIRVVIGLTQTLGVGVNMQKNLRAMHHLDAPWMPGELEQRNGRGLRQGNQWNTVLEYRYITDKLDGKSWQVLAIKDRFINSFMKADSSVRSIEGDAAADNGDDNGGDIMSSFSEASGDPRVLQRIKMKGRLEKLQRKERMHTQGIADMRRTIGTTQRRIERLAEQIAEYKENSTLERIQTALKAQANSFSVTIAGKQYSKHKDASEAIAQYIADNVRTSSQRTKVGKYADLDLYMQWDTLQEHPTISVKIGVHEYHGNTLRGLESQLRGAPRDLEKLEQARAAAQDTINGLSKAVDQPFGQADQLVRTQKQLELIEQDLTENPVAPPIWLRRGAPIDTEVFYRGNAFVVSGHRYTDDGWFVSAEDAKGTIEIPYMEATDSVGMPIYEEHEFEAPNIEDKTKTEEVKKSEDDGGMVDNKLNSRQSGTKRASLTVDQARQALIDRFGHDTIVRLETMGKLEIIDQLGDVPESALNSILAFHGSPYKFDKFSLEHLGRGDGHQLYGFGLYFSDSKAVADFYRQNLATNDDGQLYQVNVDSDSKDILSWEESLTGQKDILNRLKPLQEHLKQLGVLDQYETMLGFPFNEWNGGELYTVLKHAARNNILPQPTIELIEAVEMGRPDKAASLYLHHLGINGLKYAQSARDGMVPAGSSNYVIFDDSAIQITDTFFSQNPDGIEGYYHNGKTTLVASNLTADTVIPAFLHEVGGHAGMQGLMKPSTYNELMRGFEAMVKSGNPLALEAKRRAEVETDPAVQQQEYLPYLISVASEAQAAGEKSGALQAIQRFIQRVISAIKAWTVDKLGVPLKLNPDDVVALAERMVQRVAKDKSQPAKNKGSNATLPHLLGQSKTGHGGVVGNRTSEQNTLKPEGIVKKMGDKPLFSRRAPGAFAQGIKAATVQNIKDQTSYKFKDWLGVGLQVLGRRQLVDIYHKLLPQLTQYNNLAAQMDADKNDAGAKADELARRWAKVKDHEALANLMHDATLSGFDPALPYSQGDRFKYQQLRRAYDALTPEAKALYADVRDAYTDHQKAVMYAIKQRIMRSELSNQKKAELLKNMDSNFFHKRKGVYFPLARFGKYVVVVRNNAGVVESVSRAETMGEAQAMRKELLDQFPQNQGFAISEVSKDKAFVASRDMVGRGFMTELYAELDKQNIPASQKAELEDTLGQLYLSSLPDLSWAKHGIHRKGTAGFSQDARRAFAQHMFHGASYLAKLRYADLLASELDAMQKYSDQQKNNPDFDQPTAQSVIDEMNVRHESLMNPKGHPLSSALTSLGFIYHLGLSPASAIVNLLQTPLVAYPILGAKWGFDKAATALTRASAEAMKHKNELDKGLQGDELRAYREAIRRGVIDVTQAHDLAGIAQGEDSAVMWKMRPVMRWASVLFHHAERFNRGATFLAAYRLARAANTSHADAFDQAVEATYAGHFDYSSGNRARIMQGNTAKVILLFKQFSQNMIYTIARNAHQAIMATDPAKQKEARRIIRGMLITHSLAAGIYGLPLVTVLLAAASMLGSDDDEPWDAETAFRNYLADTFGATAANVMTRGVSRATPFDISGRVGLDHMIFPDTQEGLEGQRWAESFASGALGPVAGIGMNLAKGASQIADGDWARGLESMAPAALRGPLKALRYEQEGAIDKSGVSILDEVSLPSIVGQAAGFSPSSVRTATEGKSAILSMERKVASRRSDLLNDFSQAAIKGDIEKMNEIRAEIATFNQAQPAHRIQANHLMQSVRQKRKRINQAEHGVYLPRGKRELLDEGRFAFDQ